MFAIDAPWKRMMIFGILYVIEGIPQGFTEKFLPFHLARAGLTHAEIGDFGWWDTWPWTVKWMWAPFVDIFLTVRVWMIVAQVAMVLTLLPVSLIGNDLRANLLFLTRTIVIHNVFSAKNDIAIDKMAVGTLPVQEEAAVNGVMFGAQELGMIFGGPIALLVSSVFGYSAGVVYVNGLILVIFLAVTLRVPAPSDLSSGMDSTSSFGRLKDYVRNLWDSFFGGWQIWAALLFASLPSGALLLGGPHATTWMESHGLNDADVSQVELLSKVAGVATTVLGGFISSHAGPRRIVAFSYSATALLSIYISTWDLTAWSRECWILVKLLYQALIGLHVGPQMGLFMRSCCKHVGATQFTLFCCLCNNATAWAKSFHGHWIDASDYYVALRWDAYFALLPLLILPLVGFERSENIQIELHAYQKDFLDALGQTRGCNAVDAFQGIVDLARNDPTVKSAIFDTFHCVHCGSVSPADWIKLRKGQKQPQTFRLTKPTTAFLTQAMLLPVEKRGTPAKRQIVDGPRRSDYHKAARACVDWAIKHYDALGDGRPKMQSSSAQGISKREASDANEQTAKRAKRD